MAKLASIIALIAALLPLAAPPARGEAGPVFSPSGPDAAAYGADRGYPVGAPGTANRQPLMVGSYSHYDEIYRTRRIARAAMPSSLRRAPEEIRLSYRFRGETRSIDSYLSRNPVTGFLIARDDTILLERYQYGRTDRDRMTSQSMVKTIVAMLVGIAVSEGRIRSIDDPAAAYLPALAGTELGRTPLRAFLHMASGIAFEERYDGKDDVARLSAALVRDTSPVAAVAAYQRRVAPPDTAWHYAGLDTEVLALVLAEATGTSLAEYLRTRIWQPMGAEADATWVIDGSGREIGPWGFNATIRDYARLGLLLAHDGAAGGRQLVPRQWVLDATTPAAAGSFLAPGTMSRFYGYGYQVWLIPGGRREFALLGVHGQRILVDPQAKLVLVQTAVRATPTAEGGVDGELYALWRALPGRRDG